MRSYVRASVWVLFYLVLCAKSCDHQEQFDGQRIEFNKRRVMDSILVVQNQTLVTDDALVVYEMEAMRTCTDFLGYLQILTNSGAATEFRCKTKEVVRRLFLDSLSFVSATNLNTGKALPDPDTVFVSQPFKRFDTLGYSCVITCEFRQGTFEENVDRTLPVQMKAEVFLLKREKEFGGESVATWQLLIGKVVWEK